VQERWVHFEKRGRSGLYSQPGLVENQVAVEQDLTTWGKGGGGDLWSSVRERECEGTKGRVAEGDSHSRRHLSPYIPRTP
jgi:hypothetical protein